ncbi:MAG: MFS transporter [Nitrososphaerales archaeon]
MSIYIDYKRRFYSQIKASLRWVLSYYNGNDFESLTNLGNKSLNADAVLTIDPAEIRRDLVTCNYPGLPQHRSESYMLNKFSPRYKFEVLAVVAIARIVYSLNWYTLSPGLSQVGTAFNASVQSLGILESSFLAGAGLFQLPAAYAAARWNAKLLIISGLSLIALTNGLASFAPSLVILTILRFFLGVGAAMFFSPAIVVVAPLFRNEKQGLALGVYSSAFNIGGAIALLGWAYIVEIYTWRIGLLIGAALAVPVTAMLMVMIKHSERDFGQVSADPGKAVFNVLKSRQIWYMGVGIVGLWSASYVISQFLPYFETTVNLMNPAPAGFLASLILVVPIPGSILGGWLSDKLRNRKAFLLYPTIAFGFGTALIGFAKFDASFAVLSMLGLLQSFSFVSMYAAPFQMDEIKVNEKAISISLMNSVQILGAFILPILFASVALNSGYEYTWIIAGAFTLGFVPFLVFVREPFMKKERAKIQDV